MEKAKTVFIDCTSLYRGGGVAVYIEHILHYMPEKYRAIIAVQHYTEIDNKQILQIKIPMYNILTRLFYEHLIFPFIALYNKAETYFSPKSYAPLVRTMHTISTIHDIIPIKVNSGESLLTRIYWHIQLYSVAKLSHGIIFINEYVKQQFYKRFNAAKDIDNKVIHNGYDAYAVTEQEKKYILIPGTLKIRKQTMLALQLAKLLKMEHDDAEIIITGRNDNRECAYTAQGDNNVNYAGYVSREKMQHYMNNALIIIYMSNDEGFSLPIAESMFLHKPVVCSDIAVNRHLYSNYPIYYNTSICIEDNVKNISEQMEHYDKKSQDIQTWEHCSEESFKFIFKRN